MISRHLVPLTYPCPYGNGELLARAINCSRAILIPIRSIPAATEILAYVCGHLEDIWSRPYIWTTAHKYERAHNPPPTLDATHVSARISRSKRRPPSTENGPTRPASRPALFLPPFTDALTHRSTFRTGGELHAVHVIGLTKSALRREAAATQPPTNTGI